MIIDADHERFWSWFSINEARLRTLPRDAFAFELEARVHDVDPRIGIEFEIDVGDTPAAARRALIFTANGARDLFAPIRALVAAAPPLPHWQPIALKPPRGAAFRVTLGGTTLAAFQVSFVPLGSADGVGVRLLVDLANAGDEDVAALVWVVVETAIGEEAAAAITAIEIAPRLDATGQPLDQLPAYVAERLRRAGGG